jgi:hypothetical protein
MRWSDIERAQPRPAGVGRARLIEPGAVFVATPLWPRRLITLVCRARLPQSASAGKCP